MQRKTLTCLFISMLTAVAPTTALIADESPTIQQLDAQWKQGELSTREYTRAVNDWINLEFTAGVHFHRDTLIQRLSTFRELAWSADSLSASRINYYINLSNNANYGNREGEGIYFLEKAEQEILAAHGEKPLLVAGRKCNMYVDKRNYKKVVATYNEERDYIEQFPELLQSKAINLNIAASFINVLNPTAIAYATLGDTTSLNETIALAEAIYSELEKQMKPTSHTAFTVHFYMKNLYYHKYFTAEHHQQKSLDALNTMRTALYTDTTIAAGLVGQLVPVLETKLIDYFLTYKQNDSAAFYIAKLKATPGVFTDHDFALSRFESELLANQGKYQLAFERATDAVHDIDSIQSILINDIDELLYAHTEAEFNRQALQTAEQEKGRRTAWLIAVSVFAVAAVAIVYLIIRRREKKTQAQIENLNNAANIQIAAMEEIKTQAVRDEQKRLARDLHDGLSSTLAGAKLQLELLALDSVPKTAGILTDIQNQIEQAYTIARGKSHQWYDMADGSAEADFAQRIQQLLDSALADGHYTKEIHVDDDTLSHLPLDARIDLLRIVQEAITNTLKHANARHVAVLLYREDPAVVLSVADDGKGTKSKNTSRTGIGVQSMRDRAEQHGGTLRVESNPNGTQITASIPLALQIAAS
ncbi:sensor histidine kinase [Parapedobacter sp. 10938]|uniref:sensor histidine kinase n=1 Tax=Parapedobacter flavus TaxID=3110225 RepID=UPI002DB953BB|nr:ATP-binding protein [Parapedobacter sp. 10938]MEC3879585.1 ATP-binding protein [Parapedobacter sp. 10938]